MIVKYPRLEDNERYNLRVIDANGNVFDMWVAGNHDLYWVPKYNKNCDHTFVINKSDEFLYGVIDNLFEKIKENDNPYRPSLVNVK